MFLHNDRGSNGKESLLYKDEKQSLLPDDSEIDVDSGQKCADSSCDNFSSQTGTNSSAFTNSSMDDDETKPIMNGNMVNVELSSANTWTNHNRGRASSCDQNNHCHPPNSHQTSIINSQNAKQKLTIGMILCLIFMVAEFLGGYFANSLAIMTEAAHLLTDLASFLLNLFAVWISQKRPTKRMSFGFSRAEVLGAVAGIFLIWIITGILFFTAVERIRHPNYEIDTNIMLIISGCGVMMNVVICLCLGGGCSFVFGESGESKHGHAGHGHLIGSHHGHSHTNMNVRAALIHTLGDLVQSVGVLVAAIVIHFKPEYKLADPICTFIFSFLVLFTTINIMKDAVNVLMEATPLSLNYDNVKEVLEDIDGVHSVHSLHIWSLSLEHNALAVHLAIDSLADFQNVLRKAERVMRANFNIQQTTIQVERFEPEMSDCDLCIRP